MKRTIFPAVFALSSLLFGCKEEKNQEVKKTSPEQKETIRTTPDRDAATYAELSIRKGDDWEPKKYGGGEFMNVDSLELPPGHSDHAYYIRYEGPGWENSQVGYRFYLDWRNAIDIWGKKTDTIVLPYVGQDDYESYHHSASWGQDILKAGKSLGLGGYGRFLNDSVAHFRNVGNTTASVDNTSEYSSVSIDYDDWETGDSTIDLDAEFRIFPSDRYSRITLKPSKDINGICAGMVSFENIPLLQKKSEGGQWGYIATYGSQTLVNDNDKLGMAIFYKSSEVERITDGPHDHLVIFKPTTEKLTYYILAAWEQEKKAINTKDAFIADINQKLELLENNGKLN